MTERPPTTCALCQTPLGPPHTWRVCRRCGAPFCWSPPDRCCGERRAFSLEDDLVVRADYRCRRCRTRTWRWFGADFAEIRPLLLITGLFVLFAVVFWIGALALLALLLRLLGLQT